jgi:hypothetical protein
MRTGTKLAAYGAALAIVLGGGAGLGAAAGPIDVGDAESSDEEHDVHATDDAGSEAVAADPGTAPAPDELPGGLAVAQQGYRLVPETDAPAPGEPAEWTFRIVDASGAAVTAYEEEHERDLHLIVVGRNLVDYGHLHPTLAPDGLWSVELPALPPGSYRAYADFRATGADALTLGVDLTVGGSIAAVDVPRPSSEAVVDGYEVGVEGEPQAGESELVFTVRRDGDAVRTEPYLGAAGHLVAIRDGDLAYLHVHPLDGDGNEIRFAAEFPSPGTYRLFLDFAHGGQVRTAAFTLTVPDGSASGSATASATTTTHPPASGSHDEGH